MMKEHFGKRITVDVLKGFSLGGDWNGSLLSKGTGALAHYLKFF